MPSADWAFADCRSVPFPGTPDPGRICLKGGFDPAYLYQLTYTAKDPLVLGLGFNQDEGGRIVWDGANAHIAGRLVPLNIRFGFPWRGVQPL